jgi:hypothetical protein
MHNAGPSANESAATAAGDADQDGPRRTHALVAAWRRAASLPAQLRASGRYTPGKVAFQLVGLAVSIGLLVWLISLALSEENRAAWRNLAEASLLELSVLFGATLASIVFNGLIFWSLIRRHHRLSALELVAVNALSTLLASLPFKLGVLIRGLIHHRRDGLPFKFLIGWFAAVAVLGVAVFVPLAGLSLWRRDTDVAWWVGAVVVFVASHGVAMAVARHAQREGWAPRWLRRASLGAHGFLLAPGTLALHAAMRALDIVSLAGRFLAAAWVLGISFDAENAVLLGCTFFLLSVLAPTGNLGVREAGTTALAAAVGLDLSEIGALVLVVSATEVLVALVVSLPSAAFLRLDRILFRPRGETLDEAVNDPKTDGLLATPEGERGD